LPSAHDVVHRPYVSLSLSAIRPVSSSPKHCVELYAALKRMARLDHAITALELLGSVVQAVPVVGENLKSAIEIATKTCEMVKVRMLFLAWCSRSTICVEDAGQPRAVRAAFGPRD
jgi:hypothetical protein